MAPARVASSACKACGALGDDLTKSVVPRPVTAVLLDRDGVINEPVIDPRSGRYESPYAPEDVALVPGAAEVIAQLTNRGIPLAVVSNQPAAAKQTCSIDDLASVDARVRELLAAHGVEIGVWKYCFHHPQGTDPELGRRCECRKPEPGLLIDALADLGVPASKHVVIVGDSDADIGAGLALGLTTILVEHPNSAHRRGEQEPDFRVSSAAAWANVLMPDD